jgi:hypothetical protein
MNSLSESAWDSFGNAIEKLHKKISQSKAVNVNAVNLREQTQEVVQFYFRQTRPEIQALGVDNTLIAQVDESMQALLRLSKGANSKKMYLGLLKSLTKLIVNLSGSIELRHAEREFLSRSSTSISISQEEIIIYETLLKLIPTAALSYKQALLDLADENRISFRGVATEFRESLRETLDHLAPDKNVVAQPNFKYEKDKKTPTMKQKVRFILRMRELPNTAIKSPEDAVETIDERIASFARSVYERSSISTHVATQKSEVLQVKKYVSTVLAELLGIQV